MLKLSLFLLVLSCQAALGSNWRPSERFMSALRHIESSNGAFLYGDDGHSRGDFQMSEAAWIDVNAWRKTHKLARYSYDRYALNPQINRLYAADYLSLLHNQLKKKLSRPPNSGELYAAYNMGLRQFARCGYRLDRVNALTLKKCRQIVGLLEAGEQVQASGRRTGARI